MIILISVPKLANTFNILRSPENIKLPVESIYIQERIKRIKNLVNYKL